MPSKRAEEGKREVRCVAKQWSCGFHPYVKTRRKETKHRFRYMIADERRFLCVKYENCV